MSIYLEPTAIDRVMRRIYRPDAPGAALAVVSHDRVVFKGVYGLADLGAGSPVTQHSGFRLASLTKQFTAISILKLVQTGQLRLEDPVGRYVPGLPHPLGTPTLFQLLTHTSGLPDYERLIPSGRSVQVADEDIPGLLRTGKEAFFFTPGAFFRYSNTGYCLLALVVEQVSGQSFADFQNTRLFVPASMEYAVVYDPAVSIPHRAFGYIPNGSSFDLSDQSVTSATRGDGGIYASLDDYLRWLRALEGNVLLPAGLTTEIFEKHTMVGGGVGYGYGWFVAGAKDRPGPVFHTGESTGFRNLVYLDPVRQLRVVILSNREDQTLAEAFDLLAEQLDLEIRGIQGKGRSLVTWLSGVYGI